MDELRQIIADARERIERYVASRPPIEQAILRAAIAEQDERDRLNEELAMYGDGSGKPEGVMRG